MTTDNASAPLADEPIDGADENTETDAPLNRAERRALKRGKGKNTVKGVRQGPSSSGFNPKDVKVAGHKEFTNRKSG
jgi:hypothetical protein